MTSCLFKRPTHHKITLEQNEIEAIRFESREGISATVLSAPQLELQIAPTQWPFKSFSQLVFVMKGKISITLPDSGTQNALTNEWLVYSSNGWPASCRFSGPLQLIVVELSKEFWESLATDLDAHLHLTRACLGCPKRNESLFVKGQACESMLRICQDICGYTSSSARESLLADARTLELTTLVADHRELSSKPNAEPCYRGHDEKAIAKAATYLEENLDFEHSLAGISRKAHINEFKLKRGFRQRYKTTVFRYLRQKRMERANKMLRAGGSTVLEIANAVGYSNPSHFARAFRQAFGSNPSELAVR